MLLEYPHPSIFVFAFVGVNQLIFCLTHDRLIEILTVATS